MLVRGCMVGLEQVTIGLKRRRRSFRCASPLPASFAQKCVNIHQVRVHARCPWRLIARSV
eukprot:6210912-Pleurochrysis_carterae.AAC.1